MLPLAETLTPEFVRRLKSILSRLALCLPGLSDSSVLLRGGVSRGLQLWLRRHFLTSELLETEASVEVFLFGWNFYKNLPLLKVAAPTAMTNKTQKPANE